MRTFFIVYENLCGDIITTSKYGYLKTQKSKAWINTNATIVNWNKKNMTVKPIIARSM